jgi:hypothetical protein
MLAGSQESRQSATVQRARRIYLYRFLNRRTSSCVQAPCQGPFSVSLSWLQGTVYTVRRVGCRLGMRGRMQNNHLSSVRLTKLLLGWRKESGLQHGQCRAVSHTHTVPCCMLWLMDLKVSSVPSFGCLCKYIHLTQGDTCMACISVCFKMSATPLSYVCFTE